MARRNQMIAVVAAVVLACTAACSSGGSGTPSSNPTTSSGGTGNGTFQAAHKGGTLHLVAQAAGGTLDPQVNYTLQYWQLYQGVYDGLLNFKKVAGEQSFTVVPDLATSMPKVSDGGKTYTFTLRRGIKFSNGQPLTVKDVVASFQRLFKVSNPNAGSWYSSIVGAAACLKTPQTCTLAGGVSGDAKTNTVTFHLTQPDAEFIDQISVPFGSIVPADSPAHDAGTQPLPGTGAYYFASYNPNRALILKRNPHFHVFSQAAQPQGYPDEIEMTFGLSVESEVTAVQNGTADWMFDPPPPDRLAEISSKYATQAHVNALTAFWYLALNTNIPPFNNLKARQAINWAVDRNSIVKLYGGAALAQPVCTILPPKFPGHVDTCDYTKGGGSTWKAPDLAKAKALVQASGTAGQSVGVVVSNDTVNLSIGQYLQSLLNDLGYKATLKPLSGNIQFTYIQNSKNKAQLSLSSWYQDYPAASDFLQVLLSCASFRPGSDSSINISGYCNKTIDAKMTKAEKLEVTNATAANTLWGQVDQAYMKEAPVAPLITPKLLDFVSKRVGNYEFSLQYYMLIDQLWVK